MSSPPGEDATYHGEVLRGRVVGRAEVRRRFGTSAVEAWKEADRRFPVRLTRSWVDRMEKGSDPLGRQALPDSDELLPDPNDLADPVGEGSRSPVPWLVQKHPDRALLRVTNRCHLYCRYCFRRDQHSPEEPDAAALRRAIAHAQGAGVRELILSGGDPLTLRDDALFGLIDLARPAIPLIRVHTRAPITAPERVSPALVEGLRARAPLWLVVHANHPRELSADVRAALARLVDAGIPVLNQSVLLAGVNDEVEVLEALCVALVELRVQPYYLHHPDPVPGNARFRLDLMRGLALHRELSGRLSGLALPRYVIDPPDGSGKIEVATWLAMKTGGDTAQGEQIQWQPGT